MDTFKLKVFAISAMLIDHIGIILVLPTNQYWLYLACRAIGRLAFPIFAFLIVEGFYHTRNVKNYLRRLFLFALISELPFDIALYQYHFNRNVLSDIIAGFQSYDNFSTLLRNFMYGQNVFFTLFLGLLLIYLFDLVDKKYVKNDFMSIAISNMIDGLILVAVCMVAYIFRTDYEVAGILMIAAFYLFRASRILIAICIIILSGSLLCDFTQYQRTGNLLNIVSLLEVLAIIPISLYHGKKGKSIKYLFYAFYPVHLICLFFLAHIFKLV